MKMSFAGKTRRSGIVVTLLLIVGGSVGFLIGYTVAHPPAARADETAVAPPAAPAPPATARVKSQRFGSMIGLRPEKKEEYIRLHANCWPEILAILKKCHIGNYSIYLGEVDGKMYLFSYFEYTGDDLTKDLATIKAEPKMREWWTLTDPCQIRLPDTKQGDWWKSIPEVFHTN